MRKFKHKYLSMTAEHLNSSSDCMVYMNKCGEVSVFLDIIPIEAIENSADWEEIVEKDWVVIQIREPKGAGGFLYNIVNGYRVGCSNPPKLKDCLIPNHPDFGCKEPHTIHKVYCKSTKKHWKVGDKTQFGTIEKFEIADYGKCLVFYKNKDGYERVAYLSELTEPKEEREISSVCSKGLIWSIGDDTQYGKITNFNLIENEIIAETIYTAINYMKVRVHELKKPKEEKCYPKGIVSFMFDNHKAFTKHEDLTYEEWVSERINNPNYSIYEVTNGTDNFKVGDEIVANYGMPKRIKSFSIIDGEIQAVYDCLGGTMEACKELSKLIKYEQPKVTVRYEYPLYQTELEVNLKQENKELKKKYDTLWNQYKHLLGLTK